MLNSEVLEYFRNNSKNSILYGKLSDNLDFVGNNRWVRLKNYIVKIDRIEKIKSPNYCKFYVHDKSGGYNFLAHADDWTQIGDIILVPAAFITYPNGQAYMQTPIGYTTLRDLDDSNLSKIPYITDDNIDISTKNTYYINNRCVYEVRNED